MSQKGEEDPQFEGSDTASARDTDSHPASPGHRSQPTIRTHYRGVVLPPDWDAFPLNLRLYKDVQLQTMLAYQFEEEAKFNRRLTLEDLPDILGEEAMKVVEKEVKQRKEGPEKKKQKKDAMTGDFNIFKSGCGVHGKLPKPPKKDLKGKTSAETRKFHLLDKFELETVKEYLQLNGEFSLVQESSQTPGDCLFTAILAQLGLQEGDADIYTARDLRRQAVCIMGMLIKGLPDSPDMYPAIAYEIAGLYGSGDDAAPGPFTVLEYMEQMLRPAFYGDSVVIHSLAWHWDIKITVLNVKTLREQRFRHNEGMEAVDLVLVYNGHNHYIGAVRDDEEYLEANKVVRSSQYDDYSSSESEQPSPRSKRRQQRRDDADESELDTDYDPDAPEEEEEEPQVHAVGKTKVTVDKSEWERLRGAAFTLEKIKGYIRKQSRLPGPDPKDVKEGDTKCPECKDEFKTTRGLRKHYHRFHVGETNYRCNQCDRIFGDARGLRMHAKTHEKDGGKVFECSKPDCNEKFATDQAKKSHEKAHEQRGKGPGTDGKYPCEFNCGREFELPKGVTEHVRSCKLNPGMKKRQCPHCNEELSAKYFQKHLRRVHNFSK